MQQSGRNRGIRSVGAVVGAAWLCLTGCTPEEDWELTEIGVEEELSELEDDADEVHECAPAEPETGLEQVHAGRLSARPGDLRSHCGTSAQSNHTWLKGDKISPPANAAKRATPKPAAPAP